MELDLQRNEECKVAIVSVDDAKEALECKHVVYDVFSLVHSQIQTFGRLRHLSLFSRMGAGREVSISLDGVRDKNLMQLKKLNLALFPVRYNDKYYTDALASGEFTKLAYYSDICVGAIACRLEKKEGGGQVRVYIMTLGVLAPYRGLGIGTRLLNHVLDLCSKQNISEVYLHVQTNNEDAINFYKKFGFEITETIQNYYTNITPPDCYVLTRYTVLSTTKK
ncbi:N-alpha-acetyltransferase 50 [Glycine soja]|nr:Chlorophyll a-b binding protein 3, chloroplastic isoform C [Glycine soja]